MKTTIIIVIIIIAITVLVLYVFSGINKSINNYYFPRKNVHQYGEVVNFEKAEKLIYPDFIIAYQGIKKSNFEVPNTNKVIRTISTDIFSVCTPIDQSTQTDTNCTEVKWSPGLGELAPTRFTVKGQKYTIVKIINDGTLDLSSKSGEGWVIDKADKVIGLQSDNLVVDESYLLGRWKGENNGDKVQYVFQEKQGTKIFTGFFGLSTGGHLYTFGKNCTWSYDAHKVLSLSCEGGWNMAFDTVTKGKNGNELYIYNKDDKSLGSGLRFQRVSNSQK